MRRFICLLLIILFPGALKVNAFQESGSVIKGKVTDISGKSLTGAGVTIENTFIGIHTGLDGTYSIPGLKDGNYRLSFSFIGYETQSKEVNHNGETIFNVVLSEKTCITS